MTDPTVLQLEDGQTERILTEAESSAESVPRIVEVTGPNPVRVGHNERYADVGTTLSAGQSHTVQRLRGEALYAAAFDGETSIRVQRAAADVQSQPERKVEIVNPESPLTNNFAHEFDDSVDVNSSTEVVELTTPDRSESLTVHVDDWDGAGHVAVSFLDAPGGSVVTTRDDDDSGAYGTNGTDDVYVDVTIASPFVRVEIVDDSGASNVVDYTIYAR